MNGCGGPLIVVTLLLYCMRDVGYLLQCLFKGGFDEIVVLWSLFCCDEDNYVVILGVQVENFVVGLTGYMKGVFIVREYWVVRGLL